MGIKGPSFKMGGSGRSGGGGEGGVRSTAGNDKEKAGKKAEKKSSIKQQIRGSERCVC